MNPPFQQTAAKGWRNTPLLLLSIALSSCAVKPPTPDFEGKPISSLSIHYQGKPTVDEKRLREFITSKAGTLYSKEHVDHDIKALYESGYVDDVRFRADPDGDAVRLIAEVQIRLPMGPDPPFILGNTAFPDLTLSKASKLKIDNPTDIQLGTACRNIEKYYRNHGYKNARVFVVYPWPRETDKPALKVEEGEIGS